MTRWIHHRKRTAKRQGFTLLELLMVVIIIGILASIAIPQFQKVRERARTAEAIGMLGTIFRSEVRYRALHPNQTFTVNLDELDVDQNDLIGQRSFNYVIADADNVTFNAKATRENYAGGGGCVADYALRIDANANLYGTGCDTTSP